MTHRIAAVIPARWGSTRFPGKPLAAIEGRPMIVHVCERAARAARIEHCWVATDDERIAEAVAAAGFEARMTPAECPSGTDRIVASLRADDPWNVLVNVQGDEPRMAPEAIDAAVEALLACPDADVGTVMTQIVEREDFESPHVVKVVCDPAGRALYFSRSPLPSPARLSEQETHGAGFVWGFKHLGLYAYHREVIEAFQGWAPSRLEQWECLEQLRFLEHGVRIQVAEVAQDSVGIDTPEDLERLSLEVER